MLEQWNGVLPALHQAIQHPDVATGLTLYGAMFVDADRVDIPSTDLPAGIPKWMYDDDGWARRVGSTPAAKRANITITVPENALP
jgi:uracil-DNA glycosylase